MSSWLSPRVEKRASGIEGRGLFAVAAISAGEVVAVKGGTVRGPAEWAAVRDELSPAEIQIEDDLWIGPAGSADKESNLLCLNHSCDPNVGVRGQVTFVAMCDVAAGEELTIDYAMIDGEPDERLECACGAQQCRRTITGDDWRRPELQRRYRGYFSRYLQDRIDAEEASRDPRGGGES